MKSNDSNSNKDKFDSNALIHCATPFTFLGILHMVYCFTIRNMDIICIVIAHVAWARFSNNKTIHTRIEPINLKFPIWEFKIQ